MSVPWWYRHRMTTNIPLPHETNADGRERDFDAQRRLDDLMARGLLRPATPYREIDVPLTLPVGVSSLELMDREDRF